MDFLKKNWSRIVFTALFLTGAVLFMILIIRFDAEWYNKAENLVEVFKSKLPGALGVTSNAAPVADAAYANSVLFGYIAALSFFLGFAVFQIMKMFEAIKPFTKWVLLIIAVLGTTFMILSIGFSLGSENMRLINEFLAANISPDIVPAANWAAASGIPGIQDTLTATLEAAQDKASFALFAQTVTMIGQLIIFGLLPLTGALRKIICNKEE